MRRAGYTVHVLAVAEYRLVYGADTSPTAAQICARAEAQAACAKMWKRLKWKERGVNRDRDKETEREAEMERGYWWIQGRVDEAITSPKPKTREAKLSFCLPKPASTYG